MLRFQPWKIITILVVITIGIIYALPNFYPPSPAVQISIDSIEGKIPNRVVEKIYRKVEDTGLASTAFGWLKTNEEGLDSIIFRTDKDSREIMHKRDKGKLDIKTSRLLEKNSKPSKDKSRVGVV